MSEILASIYDRSLTLVFGNVFFSSFGDAGNLSFEKKSFQNLVFMFYFYLKQWQNWF